MLRTANSRWNSVACALFLQGCNVSSTALDNQTGARPTIESTGFEGGQKRKFIVGSLLDIAIHETGHLLISQLQLPVLGNEETAADNLSTVYFLSSNSEQLLGAAVQAANGHFLRHQISKNAGENLKYDGEHDLGIKRGFRTVCLMYGYNERYEYLADQAGLGESRKSRCRSEFETASRSWNAVLKPHLGSSQGKIAIKYGSTDPSLVQSANFLKRSKVLENVVGSLSDKIELKRAVSYEARQCGTANAFYEPSKRRVIICYELVPALTKLWTLANQGR